MLPGFTQYIFSKKTAHTLGVLLVAVFFVASFFGAFDLTVSFAQNVPDNTDALGVTALDNALPLAGTDIRVIALRIINIFLTLLGIITVGLILYAGGKILFSNGNEDAVAEGRRIITNAIIGLIIIMSAWGITRFILSRFAGATGTGSGAFVAQGNTGDTFFASGALGRAVRDHYPFRNQRDVPRNSRISVTFREAVYPGSIADDRNGNGIFGDCVTPAARPMDWSLDCDRATAAVRLTASGTPSGVELAAILSYAGDGTVRTVLFRPLELLGNETDAVRYTVDLLTGIQVQNRSASIFANERAQRYSWNFETNTELDTIPPRVTQIYPNHASDIARNTIVQVQFNEAMDPTVVQGQTGVFTHIVFGSSAANGVMPSGEWRVSNGYQSVEFIPSEPCGRNSCGDAMYCLPTICTDDSNAACANPLTVLIRTADVIGNSFEAVPFSGVMDMAGNALDSSSGARNGNGVFPGDGRLADPHKPSIVTSLRASATEQAPDNFWWSFEVEPLIDRSVPYIREVRPAIDEEAVQSDAPTEMTFAGAMWPSTLLDIGLTEHPAPAGIEAPWVAPIAESVSDALGILSTRVTLRHRMFGPNGQPFYYFVRVPSSVRGANQNCFYPGRGPIANSPGLPTMCDYEENADGVVVRSTNCAPVLPQTNVDQDTGCIQTTQLQEGGQNLRVQADIPACISVLQRPAISPVGVR